jgi:hypothetical protein
LAAPLGLRQGLRGLQRISDDDQVGTAAGQHAADRGREPAALRCRLERDAGPAMIAQRQGLQICFTAPEFVS